MSKTTFKALLTVMFIMVGGTLPMLSSDDHKDQILHMVAQAEDYLTGAKDAATSAADNAEKSMGAVRDALGKISGS